MPDTSHEVLIVGSGLAGLTATLAATGAGRRVRLVTNGMGTLAISGGCIDLLGYVGGELQDDPWAGLERLPEDHPYRLLGPERAREAVAALLDCLARRGYPLHHAGECNTLVPTIMGTLKPTYLVPESLNPQALARARRVLVLSVAGLRDCRPALAIGRLKTEPGWTDREYTAADLDQPLREGAHRSLNALDLARFVERPEGRDWLMRGLASLAGRFDLALLPPMLGSRAESAAALQRDCAAALGCPLVEMQSLPPGVGGLRLRDALLKELAGRDFELVENAEITGAETEGGVCRALVAQTPGGERRFAAKSFVIATGGILSGGVKLTPGRATEAVFGIDIPTPARVEDWSEPDVFASHLFSRLGVRVDGDMRPLDGDGRPLWRNVFFAGRSVGGYDYAIEKSGHGVALATGRQAGLMAAQAAETANGEV